MDVNWSRLAAVDHSCINTAVIVIKMTLFQNVSQAFCFHLETLNQKLKTPYPACLIFPPKGTGVVISKDAFLLLSWYSHIHKDVGFFECFINVKKTLV